MAVKDYCNIYGGFTIYAKWGEIQGDLLDQTDLAEALKVNWGEISGNIADQTDLNNILNSKMDKIEGKSLSTNDYTNEDKNKVLSAIQGVKGNGTLLTPDINQVVNVTPSNIGAVPTSRTINGKSLANNITLFTYGKSNPSGGSNGNVYFKHS